MRVVDIEPVTNGAKRVILHDGRSFYQDRNGNYYEGYNHDLSAVMIATDVIDQLNSACLEYYNSSKE